MIAKEWESLNAKAVCDFAEGSEQSGSWRSPWTAPCDAPSINTFHEPPCDLEAFRTTLQNRDQEKLVQHQRSWRCVCSGFSSGLVQVKSITHCCAAGAYATIDIVQRSGCMFPPCMWILLFKAVLMKVMPNVDVILRTCPRRRLSPELRPTAGESAILSLVPPCWALVHDQ